jgi:hypothetical protein
MQSLGIPQWAEIVDHGGANGRSSGWDHPVGEVQHVGSAEEALRRRTPEPAPGRANRVAERNGRDASLDRKITERGVEHLPASDADRTEGHELVRSVGSLGHSLQGAEDVVPDARPRMRERRDVVRDPHGAV